MTSVQIEDAKNECLFSHVSVTNYLLPWCLDMPPREMNIYSIHGRLSCPARLSWKTENKLQEPRESEVAVIQMPSVMKQITNLSLRSGFCELSKRTKLWRSAFYCLENIYDNDNDHLQKQIGIFGTVLYSTCICFSQMDAGCLFASLLAFLASLVPSARSSIVRVSPLRRRTKATIENLTTTSSSLLNKCMRNPDLPFFLSTSSLCLLSAFNIHAVPDFWKLSNPILPLVFGGLDC